MDLVIVCKANPESYVRVVQVLREEGFNPVALENPHSNAIYVPKGGYRRGAKTTVYIAVPRDEKLGANSVLRKWDEVRQSNVKKLTKTLGSQFFCSILIIIPVAVVLRVFDIWEYAPLLPPLTWFAALLLIANAKKIRKKQQ